MTVSPKFLSLALGLLVVAVGGSAHAQAGACVETVQHPIEVTTQGAYKCRVKTTFLFWTTADNSVPCQTSTITTPAYASADGPPSQSVRAVFIGFVQAVQRLYSCEIKVHGPSVSTGGVKVHLGNGSPECKEKSSSNVQGPANHTTVADASCREQVITAIDQPSEILQREAMSSLSLSEAQ